MASPGLLFLLLSSSLLPCSLSSPSSSKQQKHLHHHRQKRGSDMEDALTAAGYVVNVLDAASPYIGMIPIAGSIINDLVKVAKCGLDAAKPDPNQRLLNEFEKLHQKLGQYHAEQKWNIWASHFADYETKINGAFEEFTKVYRVLTDPKSNKDTRNSNIEQFKNVFAPIALSTKALPQKITEAHIFSTDFRKLITEHLKCHEKELRQFTAYLIALIHKGNTVNHFYNSLMGTDDTDRLADMAYNSAKVMYEIHKDCISKSIDYVKIDVKDQIDTNKDRTKLAKDIRLFLEQTYTRYDWISVAFIAKHSSFNLKIAKPLNKHILSSAFVEQAKEGVTVAVARQLKGTHTKAAKVREAINTCFMEVECHEVSDKLSKCKETVDGVKLGDTYTAVHAFTSKSHDSFKALDAKEAPEEEYIEPENPSTIPYIYTRVCDRYKIVAYGQFRLLIKSDEEIMKKSPCEKMNCGVKGKCELLDKNIAVCVCEQGFYGQHCEESVEEYKKNMKEMFKLLKSSNCKCKTCQ